MKIAARLIISFLILIIVPLSFIGYISERNMSKAITDEVSKSTNNTVMQLNTTIETIINMLESTSTQVFGNSQLQDLLTADKSTLTTYDKFKASDDITKILNSIIRSNNYICRLAIVNDVDSSYSSPSLPFSTIDFQKIKNSAWYKEAVAANGKNVWIDNHDAELPSSTSDASYVISSVRLMKNLNTGKAMGVLIMDVSEKPLRQMLSNIKLGQSGDIHIVAPTGKIIGNLNETEETLSALKSSNYFQEVFSTSETSGVLHVKDTQPLLVSYYKSPTTGWTVIGVVPENELTVAASRLRNIIVLIGIIAGAIAVAFGILIALSMSRRLGKAMSVAAIVENGDLTANIDIKGKDEIARLAVSLNSMISKIKSLIQKGIVLAHQVSDASNNLASVSEETSAASSEISAAIQQIAKGASEQAVDASTGAERTVQLAERIDKVSQNAESMNTISTSTLEMTFNGLKAVEILKQKAQQVNNVTSSMISSIQQLGEQSKAINNIIKVINNISDQTNLLALNAAIEAARAGEAGRGFAVVANEIRKLAEQSQKSTSDISNIIKQVTEMTNSTVESTSIVSSIINDQNNAVNETADLFQKIAQSIKQLSEQITNITLAVEEMNKNKNDVLSAIENISAVSEQSAASAQQVSASAEEQLAAMEELSNAAQKLNELSSDLLQTLAVFKIE